jgi:hypothetical protein
MDNAQKHNIYTNSYVKKYLIDQLTPNLYIIDPQSIYCID